MAVYEPTFSGLTLQNEQLNLFNLANDQLSGYLSRAAINHLIDHPDSIGIRVYNVKKSSQAGFIIATAVNADGFDLNLGIHLVSNPADDPLLNGVTSTVAPRDGLAGLITSSRRGAPREEHFSSFFLNSVLVSMLDNNDFEGICFYSVHMNVLDPSLLTGSFDASDKMTHLAIASNIVNGAIEGINSNLSFTNNLSDRPCPGHCVDLDANQMPIVSSTPLVSSPNDITGPYIPSWN